MIVLHFVQNSISYKKFCCEIFDKNAQISTISPKTEFERFFRPMVVLHLFKIQFHTKNFVAKFHKNKSISTYLTKAEPEWLIPTPAGYAFVQNSIPYNKVPSKIFHKSAQISNYSPKPAFERFFPTPGGVTLVQNLIFYKKFPSEIFHKLAVTSTYSHKIEYERFFSIMVVTHLFQIQFPTKKFLAFFIKIHRFRLIHHKLNLNSIFRPLVAKHQFKI